MNPPRRAEGSPTTDLGQLLRQLRDRRKWSQPELARRAGVSNGYIGMLEVGLRGRTPSLEKMTAIAQALAVDRVEFARLMDAAGYPMERLPDDPRDRFRNVVATDPYLRADQKKVLLGSYDAMIGHLKS